MGVIRNKELARIIEDVCLFERRKDTTCPTAKKLVRHIFDAVVKGLKRDGSVTIIGFGRFRVHKRPAIWRYIWSHKGIREWVYDPGKVVVKFEGCKDFRRSLWDKEVDGDQISS